MKKLLATLMFVTLCATLSLAGEKRDFLDGIISVALPAEWEGKMDDHEQTLTFGPSGNPTTRIGFSTPSPNHTDPAAITERNFVLINLLFDGTLNILEENPNAQYGEKHGFFTKFTVDIMGTGVAGASFAFVEKDYMVMALGMALQDDFDLYFPDFEKLIVDYGLNIDALNRNADKLKEIADTMDQNHDLIMAELEAMEEMDFIEETEDENLEAESE